jgi:hypothetical protein
MDDIAEDRRRWLKRAAAAGQLGKEKKELVQREINTLDDIAVSIRADEATDNDGGSVEADQAMAKARAAMAVISDRRKELADQTGECFDNAFRFLEEALGQGQEMVMFVTEITAGSDTSWFVENFGCDAYYRHNKELLFEDVRGRIRRELQES